MPTSSSSLSSDNLIQSAIQLLSEIDISQPIDSEGFALSDKGMAFCDGFAAAHGQGSLNLLLHFTARQINALHRDADDLIGSMAQEEQQ